MQVARLRVRLVQAWPSVGAQFRRELYALCGIHEAVASSTAQGRLLSDA